MPVPRRMASCNDGADIATAHSQETMRMWQFGTDIPFLLGWGDQADHGLISFGWGDQADLSWEADAFGVWDSQDCS